MVKTRGALSLQEDDKMDALTGVELGKVMLEGFHAGLNTAKEERKMNVPTMTIGETEQASEVKKLEEENADLKERCRMYEARIEQLGRQAEHNCFTILHFPPLVKEKQRNY